MSVELNQEAIDAIRALSDALKTTKFVLNSFSVRNTGMGGTMIELDIRQNPEGAL